MLNTKHKALGLWEARRSPLLWCIVQQCNLKFCTAHLNGEFKYAYSCILFQRRFHSDKAKNRRIEIMKLSWFHKEMTLLQQEIVIKGIHANLLHLMIQFMNEKCGKHKAEQYTEMKNKCRKSLIWKLCQYSDCLHRIWAVRGNLIRPQSQVDPLWKQSHFCCQETLSDLTCK